MSTTLEDVEQAKALGKSDPVAARAVALVRKMPGIRSNLSSQYLLESLMWLSGRDRLPQGVFSEEVEAAHTMVRFESWMTLNFYYRNLLSLPTLLQVGGACLRLAHLQQETPKRARYEAENFLEPFVEDFTGPWGNWLLTQTKKFIPA